MDEHDFTGTLEQWDDRVFVNARLFRVHRFYGNGQHDYLDTEDFAAAMVAAHDEVDKPGHRVLVYAVTETGRFMALERRRWDHFAFLWLTRKPKGGA